MVTVVPLDSEQAGQALTKLARNVPADVQIGRPFLATFDDFENAMTFFTDDAIWYSYPAHAERLAQIGDVTELTEWFGGAETSRVARRVSGPSAG